MNEKKRLIKHHTFILKQLKKEYKESVDEFYKNLLDDPDNSEPELSELEDYDLVIPAKSQKKKDWIDRLRVVDRIPLQTIE